MRTSQENLFLIRNENRDSSADIAPSLPDGVITRGEHNALVQEELTQLIRTLSAGELKTRFPREYTSWRNRKSWARKNGVEWDVGLKDFRGFVLVLGAIPRDGYTLDRINPRGPYLRDNLRWADKATQSRNRTNIPTFLVDGAVQTYRTIAEAAHKSVDAVRMALKRRRTNYLQALLPQPDIELDWDFPVAFRPALEVEYMRDRNHGESRLRFFIRACRKEFHELVRSMNLLSGHQRPQLAESDIRLVRRLHNEAIRTLADYELARHHATLYGHVSPELPRWSIEKDHPEYCNSPGGPPRCPLDEWGRPDSGMARHML